MYCKNTVKQRASTSGSYLKTFIWISLVAVVAEIEGLSLKQMILPQTFN
jgi:hypothetical protein